MNRRLIGVPGETFELLHRAKEMYGTRSFGNTVSDAVALFVQLGQEWQSGAVVLVRRPDGTECLLLKPAKMFCRESEEKA